MSLKENVSDFAISFSIFIGKSGIRKRNDLRDLFQLSFDKAVAILASSTSQIGPFH